MTSALRPHSRPATAVAFFLALLLAILALGWLAVGRAVAAPSVDIDISGLAFNPATLTVQVGDTVKWTNNDAISHTATSDAGTPDVFDSSTIAPGDKFAFTFTVEGTYAYHCSIHASMHGTVVVQAAAASPTPISSVPDGAVAGGGANPAGLAFIVSTLLLAALAGLAALSGRRLRRS